MIQTFFQSLRISLVLTLLTGALYPALVTLVGRSLFPREAEGSLVRRGDVVVGSALLAQKFEDPRYFWPRPSAGDFATVASGASNWGPTSRALKEAVDTRAQKMREAHHLAPAAQVPADLLFASGSGLDPDLSPAAVEFQTERVATARHYDAAQTQRLRALVSQLTRGRQGAMLGEPRVNILTLNLAVDELK